jgi:integrase
MGSLYHQKGSRVYWITYSVNGRRYRESTRTTNRDKAQELLAEIERRIRHWEEVTPQTLTLEDMAEAFLMDYVMNSKKSLDKAQRSVCHLYKHFGNIRARDITVTKVKAFILKRQEKGASNAEINRETAALKRMFNLAIQDGLLFFKPYIPRLDEDNVREEFFEEDAFRAVLRELPMPIKPVAVFAYYLGWRVHEITTLTWGQIDFTHRTVKLHIGTSKNKHGRLVVFPDGLLEVLSCQRDETSHLEKVQRRMIPWVFHRDGTPIKDFRSSWRTACHRAGCTGKYFHDFRRTAARNMVNAGIPERLVMDIIGHRTRAMLDRYHIRNTSDLRQAAQKMKGIISDIVAQKSHQSDTPLDRKSTRLNSSHNR